MHACAPAPTVVATMPFPPLSLLLLLLPPPSFLPLLPLLYLCSHLHSCSHCWCHCHHCSTPTTSPSPTSSPAPGPHCFCCCCHPHSYVHACSCVHSCWPLLPSHACWPSFTLILCLLVCLAFIWVCLCLFVPFWVLLGLSSLLFISTSNFIKLVNTWVKKLTFMTWIMDLDKIYWLVWVYRTIIFEVGWEWEWEDRVIWW